MADEARIIGGIDWRTTFPFTHLFRSFRLAIHPSKLLLGLTLLLLFYAGGRFLDGIWPNSARAPRSEQLISPTEMPIPAQVGTTPDPLITLNENVGPFVPFFDYEAEQLNNVCRAILEWNWVGPAGITNLDLDIPTIRPSGVLSSIYNFLVVGPRWAFTTHPLFFSALTIWFILLWSIFGGAISRIAAVHVARDEKISIRQALRFSTGKVLSFIFAPLIPIIIFFVLGILLAIGGLLNYIPFAGPILLGIIYFLALAVGFVITLVLLGTVAGFPLMYPTIAVEGSDSFDAISRSFSYVYARPWRMLFYTLVALIYGAFTYLFLRLFLFIMLGLMHGFQAWWLTGNTYAAWQTMWPGPQFFRFPYDINFPALTIGQKGGAGIIAFWLYLTISLLGAYAISFFFSAYTIVYYLLRQEVDATELDDVFIESADEEFGEAPAETAPATEPPAPESTGPAPGTTSV